MKNNVDKQYLEFLQHILEFGEEKGDRTGTGTLSVFDYSMTFDMSEGFPLLTSKKVFTKAVIHELIWFLRGDTNIKYLVDNDVHIWDGDAYKNYFHKTPSIATGITKEEFINLIKTDDEFAKKWGELGPVYGKQWRSWGRRNVAIYDWKDVKGSDQYKAVEAIKNGEDVAKYGVKIEYQNNSIDQIANLINDLKTNPDSRRLMVSAWNVGELDQMTLPPCHFGFQCYTSKMSLDERIKWWCNSLNKSISYGDDADHKFLDERGVPQRKLSLKWFQRSVDSPLGLPFNIASYAILLHLLAKEVNMVPHQLKFNGGDCHIYLNQIEGVKEQLRSETYDLPQLKLNNKSIFDIKFEDIEVVNYDERIKTIKFPLSN